MAITTRHDNARPDSDRTRAAEALQRIREALDGLRYGEVIVKVQDGVVVQVERTERVRLAGKAERVG